MKLSTRIQRLLELLKDTTIDYVSESYVQNTTETKLAGSNVPFITVIDNTGKKSDMLERSTLLTFLNNSPEIKAKLTDNEVKPKETQIYQLTEVTKDSLPQSLIDTLFSIFPTNKFVVRYGMTIRLQDVLTAYRNHFGNQELRKKDLSKWLIDTGLFYRTPQGLFTYCNNIPLKEVKAEKTPTYDLDSEEEEVEDPESDFAGSIDDSFDGLDGIEDLEDIEDSEDEESEDSEDSEDND